MRISTTSGIWRNTACELSMSFGYGPAGDQSEMISLKGL
jgi:hypothetical protein